MKNIVIFFVLLTQIICCGSALALGKPSEDRKDIVNFIFENDIFNGEDDGYTDGIRLSWFSSEKKIPKWAEKQINKFLPLDSNGKKRASFAIGQDMFTPRDISNRNFIADDRPYAGWLYTSFGLISDTRGTLDSFLIDIGIVGPWALAKQSQKFVHSHITNSPDPKGWQHQLHNEPGINLTYEKKWRNLLEYYPNHIGADFTPGVGFTLGNIYTNATIGGALRVGFDLPTDYGPPRIRPSLPGSDFFIPTQKLSGYLFAGAYGRAVARNIFLDGNSFRNSHSVKKKNWVGDFQLGAALTFKETRISYTQVFLTREFYGEDHPPRFGVLTFSYRF